MTSRYLRQLAPVVGTVASIACTSASVPPVIISPTPTTSSPSVSATTAVPMSRGDSTRAVVRVWLTTGDQRSLLSRQPDVYLISAPSERATSIATIDVNESTTYQQMIGFGAAMTDASAHLIHTMSAPQREALLQDLFGRDTSGRKIGLTFVRVPMGASDFSMRHYSYDDMPVGATDPTLRNFSIGPDRAEKIPLLQRAFAINPQLRIMASPWSPPGGIKSRESLIKGTPLPKHYAAFSDYFVKFIAAYATAGVPISAISLKNEPNFDPGDYPGMGPPAAARARVI